MFGLIDDIQELRKELAATLRQRDDVVDALRDLYWGLKDWGFEDVLNNLARQLGQAEQAIASVEG